MTSGRTVVVLALLAAQWLKLPLPGTPRTADGRPNLTAAAPRAADGHPDLSGIWMRVRPPAPDGRRGFTGLEVFQPPGFVFPYTAWGEAIFKERQARQGGGRPAERCLPHGVPDAMLPETPFKIVQHPGLTLILYEEFARFGTVTPSSWTPAASTTRRGSTMRAGRIATRCARPSASAVATSAMWRWC